MNRNGTWFRKLRGGLTGLLLLCLITSLWQPALVRAEEESAAAPTEQSLMEPATPPTEQSSMEPEATPPTERSSMEPDVAALLGVNYIYVEKPYVETPDSQTIVVSLSAPDLVDSAQLTCINETTGETSVVSATEIVEGAVLFPIEYTDESQTGTYIVSEVSAVVAGTPVVVSLMDIGAESRYGVNVECTTTPNIKIYQNEEDARLAEESESDVEMSVASFDENGSAIEGQSIEEAIAEAAEEVEVASYSAKAGRSAKAGAKGKMVVVLDPGHCQGSHNGGATGFGFREEERVFKIAQYCMGALRVNPNIQVSMTRNQLSCSAKSLSECLEARTSYARSVGADLFISFHLNSSTSGSANGAEVIVPSKNGNATVGNNGAELGQLIQNQLVALGLANRGIYSKDCTTGDTYQDGKLQDYFQVQRVCKEYGFPGIIVEHAFISNSGNVNKFIASESGLQALGEADARGIINYLNNHGAEFVYTWVKDSKGWKYTDQAGNGIKSQWLWVTNAWYHFNAAGYTDRGWFEEGGKKYYLQGDKGDMVTNWAWVTDAWYHFTTSGAMETGWLWDGAVQEWYYLQSNGKMLKDGWHKIAETQYYFNNAGVMARNKWIDGKYVNWSGQWEEDKSNLSGWKTEGGKKYYYQNGKKITGWQWVTDAWYYFSNAGVMQTGWFWDNVAVEWYYLQSDGKMLKSGWHWIEGDCYYLNHSGVMARNAWIDGYYVNWSGHWEKDKSNFSGWKTQEGKRYYYQNGKKLTGWQWVTDAWYCFSSSGAMQVAWLWDDAAKEWFYLQSNGKMLKDGWHWIDNKCYFMNNSGVMARNTWVDNYYVNWSGVWSWTGFNNVMGKAQVSVDRMVNHYNKNTTSNKWSYPQSVYSKNKNGSSNNDSASTIRRFCEILVEEANAEGVRAEIVYAQIMLETKYLQFGGDVKVNQYNFGGIGATGNGVPGNSFSSVREGLRVNVQHLKGYASTDSLKNACIDPRFQYVRRGCAPYVEWLGIQENPQKVGWAAGAEYGFNLVKLVNTL